MCVCLGHVRLRLCVRVCICLHPADVKCSAGPALHEKLYSSNQQVSGHPTTLIHGLAQLSVLIFAPSHGLGLSGVRILVDLTNRGHLAQVVYTNNPIAFTSSNRIFRAVQYTAGPLFHLLVVSLVPFGR